MKKKNTQENIKRVAKKKKIDAFWDGMNAIKVYLNGRKRYLSEECGRK